MKETVLYDSDNYSDYEDEGFAFEDMMECISGMFEPCFLVGKVGRWNGTFDGYKYVEDADSLRQILSGYDIKIVQVGTRLNFVLSHHDGTHFMELRKLTDYGYDCRGRYCLHTFSEATLGFVKRYSRNFGRVA